MKKILFLSSVLFAINAQALSVIKATCNEGEITFDTSSKDYSIAGGEILIYGDEGRTKVIKDNDRLFYVKNTDTYLRSPIDPDGNWSLPWQSERVEIKIDRFTGAGYIKKTLDGEKTTDFLTGCK